MKKQNHVFKTIILTLGVVIILAISAFGIASLLAPVAMMNFTASIGLKEISGDYAYQEYERSGDVACLARAFIVSADMGRDRIADDRFTILYGLDGFGEFCTEQDKSLGTVEGVEEYSYRGYVCGLAACVKYRLAVSEDEWKEVVAFAAGETDGSFPQGNPLIALTAESARDGKSAFCALLLEELESGSYNTESADYQHIVDILQEVIGA